MALGKFTFSAPGKTILFGEHAVVYGHAAISTAISKRMFAHCELYKSLYPEIYVEFWNKIIFYNPTYEAPSNISNVNKMIRNCFNNKLPPGTSLKIDIEENFPSGNGLGSSASLCAVLSAAAHRIAGEMLSKEKIYAHSVELEKVFHGNPSGIDPATVVFGNGIKMEKRKFEKIPVPPISMLIVDTKREHNTIAAVNNVKNLCQEFPQIYPKILESMGRLTKGFMHTPDSQKEEALMELFPAANELLRSVGVSCPESDDIVEIAERNGLAAKISGAGMGGIMLVAGPHVLEKADLFSKYNVVPASIGAEGIREE